MAKLLLSCPGGGPVCLTHSTPLNIMLRDVTLIAIQAAVLVGYYFIHALVGASLSDPLHNVENIVLRDVKI